MTQPSTGRNMVQPPDTAVTALVDEVCATFSLSALVNHCRRSFAFAAALAQSENLSVDLELLYVAAMLHDIALTTEFDNATVAFEVASGHVAWVFGAGAGWPSARRARAAEIIVAHMREPDRAADPEGYVLAAATSLDIVGAGFEAWPSALVAEIVSSHPRLDLVDQFTACFAAQSARKPDTAAAVSMRKGLAERLQANPLDRL